MATSTRTLAIAIATDAAVATLKLAVFAATGSAALLAEAMHSIADVLNQLLLAVGIRRSSRPADADHPYGYGPERYVWAMLSASGVLFIGAGATLWNGLSRLARPEPLEHLTIALLVLAAAFVAESISFTVALRGLRKSKAGGSLQERLRLHGDPVVVAVLAEDGAALLGVLTAAIGIGLSHVTGEPRFDAAAAIGVGLIMAAAGLFLIDRNRRLLVGSAPPEGDREHLVRLLLASPLVAAVHDTKATVIGPDAVRFKAELELDPRALVEAYLTPERVTAHQDADPQDPRQLLEDFAAFAVDQLGDEIDRIESEIREQQPRVRHIDLEID